MLTEPPRDPAAIAAVILDLVQARGTGKTICSSEAARRLDPDAWRALMPAVRKAAACLHGAGRIVVTQRGRPVDPLVASGPIRLGPPPARN
jgi:hypothetical protein